jgi:hypothetical protein
MIVAELVKQQTSISLQINGLFLAKQNNSAKRLTLFLAVWYYCCIAKAMIKD